MPNTNFLSGHFLIAMPGLDDSYFGNSLVYVLEHNAEGAMGIVVNQPGELNLADILEQLQPEEACAPHCQNIKIHSGGPVQVENGFVLHSSQYSFQHTVKSGEFALTTSRDILFAISEYRGPDQFLIALGYAGWGAGQLDDEIKRNSWLTCPADKSIVFDSDNAGKHNAAISSMGINPLQLSQDVGHS